jgi:hypothetical protein
MSETDLLPLIDLRRGIGRRQNFDDQFRSAADVVIGIGRGEVRCRDVGDIGDPELVLRKRPEGELAIDVAARLGEPLEQLGDSWPAAGRA